MYVNYDVNVTFSSLHFHFWQMVYFNIFRLLCINAFRESYKELQQVYKLY